MMWKSYYLKVEVRSKTRHFRYLCEIVATSFTHLTQKVCRLHASLGGCNLRFITISKADYDRIVLSGDDCEVNS